MTNLKKIKVIPLCPLCETPMTPTNIKGFFCCVFCGRRNFNGVPVAGRQFPFNFRR